MKYVDIHSHIIYGIDDGSSDLDESKKILIKAKQKDVYAICLTPHCFITNPLDIKEIQEKTKELSDSINSDIELFYGCEIMIEHDLPEFIEANEEMCLGEGKYVLVELPMFNYPVYVREVLFAIKQKGFTPIIAHPERYVAVQRDMDNFFEDIDDFTLLQLNAGSFTGAYGKKAKKAAIQLTKREKVNFVASDAHDSRGYSYMNEAYNIYEKILGKEKADEAFFYNPYKAIKGESIQ